MKKIDEIDFSELYRCHFETMDRGVSTPEQWDARAQRVSLQWQPDDYVINLVNALGLKGDETVLDVGSGAGDISLAVAQREHRVFALDFSEKMLEKLRQRAQSMGIIQKITTICDDWTKPSKELPQADVVVASRSSLIADMAKGLERLHHLAFNRVYVTYPLEAGKRVGPHFSCNHVGAGRIPPYFYLPAILYQKGQLPKLDFIEESNNKTEKNIRWVLISWDKQCWLDE